MKTGLQVVLLIMGVLCVVIGNAQPFKTIEYIDINNIRSAVLVHGDMNWDTDTLSIAEFPKGSGKHVSFCTSIWMSGYDMGNRLHVSAQTYRADGNDYWPGPLDANRELN